MNGKKLKVMLNNKILFSFILVLAAVLGSCSKEGFIGGEQSTAIQLRIQGVDFMSERK